ncbi:uroporphyrinogen decarboxylase family protein [Methanohalobium sp.]|uniref:uroporphyrinogen decarboxylase family protein n=1 Tax=Methanohalobium sp. TaxID=2837493 RepID=UPI003182EF3E
MTKPDVVHQILDKLSDMFINAIDYFADKYGPKNLLPFDGGPSESNTMISSKMFEEFAYPYVKKNT